MIYPHNTIVDKFNLNSPSFINNDSLKPADKNNFNSPKSGLKRTTSLKYLHKNSPSPKKDNEKSDLNEQNKNLNSFFQKPISQHILVNNTILKETVIVPKNNEIFFYIKTLIYENTYPNSIFDFRLQKNVRKIITRKKLARFIKFNKACIIIQRKFRELLKKKALTKGIKYGKNKRSFNISNSLQNQQKQSLSRSFTVETLNKETLNLNIDKPAEKNIIITHLLNFNSSFGSLKDLKDLSTIQEKSTLALSKHVKRSNKTEDRLIEYGKFLDNKKLNKKLEHMKV